MKKVKYIVLCVLGFAALTACNEDFNAHYEEEKGVTPEFTLWQLIEQNGDLSLFAEMLKKTGCDILLSSSQAFTVWAPVNEALQGLDMTNEEKLKDIVLTHIARFKYIAGSQTETIAFTMNAKRIRFTGSNGQYTMNNAELASANHLANNGVLHIMKERIPFVKNIWEHLTEPDMDSVKNYFDLFHLKIFSPGASKVVDYVDGMAVYDSIFFETNEMFYPALNGVGYLNNEDSVYTMILPNNEAWAKAYEQRKPYFETNAAGADSIQHRNTQYAIVRDLVFRGRIDAPGQLDSIVSTRGNVFHNPARLFPLTPPLTASNGLVYVTDELKHEYWESWQYPLQIEAERTTITLLETGVASTPAKVGYAYIPDKPDVPSRRCYLISNGNNAITESTFILLNIPNTLKAEYNVFAVFAPIRYIYPNFSSERTKIRFDIQQLSRATIDLPAEQQEWKSLVGAASQNGILPVGNNETDSAAVKKILLTKITFPEANYMEETTTIRIKLLSRLTSTEARNGYNNRMLLDYIILEPVKN
jgi:hypothetical protein